MGTRRKDNQMTTKQPAELTEHQQAYSMFLGLPSACFFSWTDNSAAFNDPADAEKFSAAYPDWKVN